MGAGVHRAFSRRSARYRGLGLQILYNSRTWSGISIQGSADTSWAMMACGKIGARSAGPIGCKVCGFRYGAGGAGISGRMLYQRSGMSFSLSRIFLVTAPSLLNPLEGASLKRVFLARQSRPPAFVAALFTGLPDQLQPRSRTVGSSHRRLPAPTLELHRPRHGDVLVGGCMQRPGRVVQVCPPEGATNRPAGQDGAVHVVVSYDLSHLDRRKPTHRSDPVRERGLVAAAEARLLFGDRLTGGHVDRVDSVSREGACDHDGVFGAQPTLEPVHG